MDFKEDVFFEKKFADISLNGKHITDKEFEKCTFKKCFFIESHFEKCRFEDCTFTECVISACKPVNSSFITVKFIDSKVIGVDWTKARQLRMLEFKNCDVSYSNFGFVKLQNLKLIDSSAKEVNFSEADLTGGIFTDTDFESAIFSNTNLSKTDFRRAKNYIIDFNFNLLKKATFSFPEATTLLNSLDITIEY